MTWCPSVHFAGRAELKRHSGSLNGVGVSSCKCKHFSLLSSAQMDMPKEPPHLSPAGAVVGIITWVQAGLTLTQNPWVSAVPRNLWGNGAPLQTKLPSVSLLLCWGEIKGSPLSVNGSSFSSSSLIPSPRTFSCTQLTRMTFQ